MFGDGNGNGYDGWSMSNNARDAYERGEKPLSKWRKADILDELKKIAPDKVSMVEKYNLETLKKYLLTRSAWHHTSMYYNETDFYSLDESYIEDFSADDVKKWVPVVAKNKKSTEFIGSIEYIEWSGTRNHLKATNKKLENVLIEEKGSFYIVKDKNGKELLRKKINSNGTYVHNYEAEERARKEREARRLAREKEIKENSSKKAYKFYRELQANGVEQSNSGKLYPRGKKPDRWNYEHLEDFFKKGDKRLVPTEDFRGFDLEVWNGNAWEVQKDLIKKADIIMPDYTIGQEEMQDFGYKRNDMLPMRKHTAKLLFELGLPIKVLVPLLNGKSTKNDVKNKEAFEEYSYNSLYGIEKTDWQEFIESNEGKAYLSARYVFCEAASHVLNEDMSYMDAMFIDGISDNLFTEKSRIKRYSESPVLCENEEIKSFVKPLLDYFTARFGSIPLEEYGWDLDCVSFAIAKSLTNDKLKEEANRIVEERELRGHIDAGLETIEWLKDRQFNKDEIANIVSDLKPYFEDSIYNNDRFHGKDYDKYYDEFAKKSIVPYLESKAFDNKQEEKKDKVTELQAKLERITGRSFSDLKTETSQKQTMHNSNDDTVRDE